MGMENANNDASSVRLMARPIEQGPCQWESTCYNWGTRAAVNENSRAGL
jgi:hypothetical protein